MLNVCPYIFRFELLGKTSNFYLYNVFVIYRSSSTNKHKNSSDQPSPLQHGLVYIKGYFIEPALESNKILHELGELLCQRHGT